MSVSHFLYSSVKCKDLLLICHVGFWWLIRSNSSEKWEGNGTITLDRMEHLKELKDKIAFSSQHNLSVLAKLQFGVIISCLWSDSFPVPFTQAWALQVWPLDLDFRTKFCSWNPWPIFAAWSVLWGCESLLESLLNLYLLLSLAWDTWQ